MYYCNDLIEISSKVYNYKLYKFINNSKDWN